MKKMEEEKLPMKNQPPPVVTEDQTRLAAELVAPAETRTALLLYLLALQILFLLG